MEPTRPIDLLAIVGPTASGKSALAMEVASITPAEIIAADSRTIYKGMNIGTAKPSPKAQKTVPHWGLDIIEPNETYSAQNFQTYANKKITQIKARQNLPILVGGSGLYIDSVLYNFKFGSGPSTDKENLESYSIEQLQKIIEEREFKMPYNHLNKRHLISTIERQGQIGGRENLLPNTVLVGLWPGDEALRANIDRRAEQIFKGGVVNETKKLINRYGLEIFSANAGIVYKICVQLIQCEIDEKTAIDKFKVADWQYARRQRTWFKRNTDITWFENKNDAFLYLKSILNT